MITGHVSKIVFIVLNLLVILEKWSQKGYIEYIHHLKQQTCGLMRLLAFFIENCMRFNVGFQLHLQKSVEHLFIL